MRTVDEIVAAARSCLGARFRPHGRDPAFGMDCVGVASIAFGRKVPGDYPMRGGSPARIVEAIGQSGLWPVPPETAVAGDLLLIDAGRAQMHLAILTRQGFVHADAALRRVVETPGRPGRPVLGAWRGTE